MQVPDISIGLKSHAFVQADSQELAERLHAETDLLVQSDVAPYVGAEGLPDVVLYILNTLATDIYVNVLSSALWDTVKAAFTRQGKKHSEAVFAVAKVDNEGRVLSRVMGRTSDPEIIKDFIRQASEEDKENNDR